MEHRGGTVFAGPLERQGGGTENRGSQTQTSEGPGS